MISFMSLQVGQLSEFFVTVTTTVWFITSMGSFMCLQRTGVTAFEVTLGTAE